MARLDYFAPGVYVEEVDRGSRPIEGVQTNIAGFVGFTETIRGGAEIGKPMLITSWNQYKEYFARENSNGFTDFDAYLPFAVNGWFLNGGARCYVVSIGTELPEADQSTSDNALLPYGTIVKTVGGQKSLCLSLKPEEYDKGSVIVEITPSEPQEILQNPDEIAPVPAEFFKIRIKREGQELERFEHLTMDQSVGQTTQTEEGQEQSEHSSTDQETQAETGDYVVNKLQGSNYITVQDLTERGLSLARRPLDGAYEVSPPPPSPSPFVNSVQGIREDRSGIQGLFEIDEVTMLACPDLMFAYQKGLLRLDQVHSIMELMISLCENSAPNPPNRMVVLDTPPECVKPQQTVHWLENDFERRSMFAALYYPWIRVPNPRKAGKPILVPPCGHMMGVWARTDESRGVYKAPANETPRGVIGLSYDCNFREQELLNPRGINCVRTFPNRGIKVWGARTLVEPDKTEWRYISVRRLISYIEKSIELGTQWVVFEPNDQDLWARVRRTVNNFLERLWREGALYGASPEQAFYVKCDEEINTPETMLLGRLYIEVGVCPVRPAEFVVFRISQWSGQTES